MEAGGQRFESVIRERIILKSSVSLMVRTRVTNRRVSVRIRYGEISSWFATKVSGVIIGDDKRY